MDHKQQALPALTPRSVENGLRLLNQGHYAEAIPLLQRAVELHPDSWKYSLALVEALLDSNYNFTALRFLRKVKSRFDGLPEYRYALALAFYLCYQY
ncbi:MAG: tetratricopeptide repeat protein, partial [Terriglobia bacterium]